MEEDNTLITEEKLRNLATAKIFKDFKGDKITCLDFSKDGQFLLACDGDSLHIFDTQTGKKIKSLNYKTKRIDNVKFTHSNQAVLCNTKLDNKIIYWSIHENEVIKIFEGHKSDILSLELNPSSDKFLSTSKDGSLKIWDLNCEDQSPEAQLDLSCKHVTNIVANFDPQGYIFAMAYTETINETKIRLISLEDLESGAFELWALDCPDVLSLKFSNNGLFILLSTVENVLIVLDAFKGSLLRKFTNYVNDNSLKIEASFTPDSKFIIIGSETGAIHIWNLENEDSQNEIVKLESHIKACQCVIFSPSHFLMASACKNLLLWIPKE